MIPELEQFLGRGDEQVLWRFSLMNFLAMVVGWLVGDRLAALLGLEGPLKLLLAAVCIVVGILLTNKQHGMMRVYRIAMRLMGLGRAVTRRGGVDPTTWYAAPTVEERAPVRLRVRDAHTGKVVLNVVED